MMIIASGGRGGNERGLIFFKAPTKCFPGHKALSKMSSIHIQFMLYVIREAGLSDSIKVPRAIFGDHAFISWGQG